MQDKCVSVSVWSATTVAAWVLTAVLVISGSITHDWLLTVPGLALSAVAATLSMRGFCVQLGGNIQAAFDLGQDAGRAERLTIERIH